MSASGLRHKAAPRSAKDWSDDDSEAERKRRPSKRQKHAPQEPERTRRATRLQTARRRQSEREESIDAAPDPTESEGYQEESSSSSGDDESASQSIEAPPARSRRRSNRLDTKQAGARPARERRKAPPPPPPPPEETSSEEDESAQEEEPPKSRKSVRRPGRRPSKLIQGGGDLSSDDYDDEDVNDFIANSNEEGAKEPSESDEATSEEDDKETEKPTRRRRKAPAGRTRAASKKAKLAEDSEEEQREHPARRRRLQKVGSGVKQEAKNLADSSSDNAETLAARSARIKGKQPAVPEPADEDKPGPSAEHASWVPPQPPAQHPAGRTERSAALAAALAEDSEEEEEAQEVPEQAKRKRRLRKASGADVTPVQGALCGADRGGGRGTRTRTLPTRPSILEQLKQHQAAHSKGMAVGKEDPNDPGNLMDGDDGMQDYTFSDDDTNGDRAGDFVIIDDDEERGSVAKAGSHGSESDASLNDFIDKDAPEEAGTGRGSAVGSPLDGLGLPYRRPELNEVFSLYLDYLLYCLADPDFEAKLEADRQKRQVYLHAVKRIEEEELATWREHYAKSDAWKRALPGFVPALEHLPGLSLSEGHYEAALNAHYEEDDDGGVRECAACERLHSRATVELVFKGRAYWPDYKYGTKSLANMAIRADDADSDLEVEDGEFKERSYVVGQHCAVRVQLYHVLWHFKRRMRGKLKKKLKKSRQFLQSARKPSSWMDAAVNVTEHTAFYKAMFYNFQGLKWAAQNYSQGSTGGGFSRAGESVRKTTAKVTELLYNLNSDSEGDEGSDLQFSDQSEDENGNGTGTEAEVASGAEDEADPDSDNGDEDNAVAEEEAGYQEADEDDSERRQLNSQPLRRRLLLPDSDADDDADASARPRSGAAAAAAGPERAAAAEAADEVLAGPGSAEAAAAGTHRPQAAAPVAALAAQSAAGVEAALTRAKGGTPTSGKSGGAATSSGASGSVKRQRGILSFFSAQKEARP